MSQLRMQLTQSQLHNLHDRWVGLLKNRPGLGTYTDSILEVWWQKIKHLYQDEARCYHTLHHILEMFEAYDANRHNVRNQVATELAIWFHDIIYNPRANNNEILSINVFLNFSVEVSLPTDITETTKRFIYTTITHKTPEHMDQDLFGGEDLHYFLDIDMAVLGKPKRRYMQYASQVREEYKHVPHDHYCLARSRLLRDFLGQANIYATMDFRMDLESRARANIETELAMLEEGIIPGSSSDKGDAIEA
eukprot:Clim_evm44s6 gene=Clim_evmTU44s6